MMPTQPTAVVLQIDPIYFTSLQRTVGLYAVAGLDLANPLGYARYWKSSKPIGANFALSGNNITIRDTIVDAYSNSSGFPFNTDGIGVGGTNILIEDSVIYNGDDAFAVGDGAHNAVIRRATIGYATHGMSIGSLGSNPASFANVSNILFDDVTVIDGLYAARFKSWSGGQVCRKHPLSALK